MRACPDPNLTVQGLKERVLIGSVQACHKSVGSDGILQLITQTIRPVSVVPYALKGHFISHCYDNTSS